MEIQDLYRHFLNSTGICTDTRMLKKGQIFFALKGQADGNYFAKDAVQKGALLAVIDNPTFSQGEKTILVEDALKTLQKLANYHRRQFNIPIIGITGSNGKTTTKELMTAVLKQKFQVHHTFGNLNNHIGVPLTLLELKQNHEVAVIEMGANHIGEIELLCTIAEPDYAVITSIGRAHIGEFGSFEAVKNTKAELYKWAANNQGKVFLNTDLNILAEMIEKSGTKQVITYGTSSQNDYVFEYLGSSPYVQFSSGNSVYRTQLIGEYNFYNLITAAAVGKYFGVPEERIVKALQNYSPQNNRSQILKYRNSTVILDAYNANPSSMESALENLNHMAASKKGAVLGQMNELGKYSREEHQKIADLAESYNLNFLVLVGEKFTKIQTSEFTLKFNHVSEVKNWWHSVEIGNTLVLVKGSRGIQLEKLFE